MRKKICMSEQTFFDHLLKLHRRQLIGMAIYITTSQKTFLFMCGQRKYMCYIHITTRKRQMNVRLAKCSYL